MSVNNLNDNLNPNVNQETEEEEIDLREIGYLLWQHITEIISCLVVGALAALLYTKFLVAPTYQSTARMFIVTSSANSVVDLSSLQIGSNLTGDYSELIKSRNVVEETIDDLKLDTTYEKLVGEIKINNPTSTRILDITVTDTDPQLAADIANTLANKAKSYIPRVMNTESPSVFEEAIVADHKASPSTSKNMALGGLLVAIIYVAYLVIKHISNDTFVTSEDIQKAFGVQPLATIPEGKHKKSKKKGAKK